MRKRQEIIQVEYAGIDFDVIGEYIPSVPGRMYMRNGDPGDPPEAAYIEDMDIQLNGISLYEVLSDTAIDAIEERACRSIEAMQAI